MATLLTKDLLLGRLYRCALSGHVVLVVSVSEYKGLYYNPVTGRNEVMTLQDGQLQPIRTPWPVDET